MDAQMLYTTVTTHEEMGTEIKSSLYMESVVCGKKNENENGIVFAI